MKMVMNTNTNSVYKIIQSQYFKKKSSGYTTVTDIQEAKKLLLQGWEYKTSYPATIYNIPHYILIKRE